MNTITAGEDVSTSSDEDEPLVKLQYLIRNPIVYTTKLDDMEIFKQDIKGMAADIIISSIIKESKPILKRKRTCSQASNSHFTHKDLLSHGNRFGKKAARIDEDHKVPICKPVKVVLEDIKYTILRTQNVASRNSETIKTKRPAISGTPKQLAFSYPRKLKSRLIYDRQLKEADLYSLDKHLFVKEHNKLRIVSTNDFIFRTLECDKNVSHVSCCCWYNREQFITSTMLGIFPNDTLRFMRKPHKCEFNRCSCCCRNESIHVSNATSAQRPPQSSPIPSKSPRIWLKSMSKIHASQPLSNESRKSLLLKSLSVKPRDIKHPVKSELEVDSPILLHSTSIDFGTEYFEIGSDGQIKLSIINIGENRQELAYLKSKAADKIVGNICCWYKREEFAGRLLILGALPNTVNYLRIAHTCSPTHCSCCCKPSNTEKPKLTFIHKAARSTNDLVGKKVNFKVVLPTAAEKPKAKVKIPGKTNEIVSFNVSLSALENVSKSMVTVGSILKDVLDLPHDQNKGSVRVLVERKTATNKTVAIECNTDLNGFTTRELALLDIIFRAVNKAKNNPRPPPPILPKKICVTRQTRVKTFEPVCNTIYPLLLNAELSVTADLRNKRFLPPLSAHLSQYRLPEMVSDINLWMAEAKQQQKTQIHDKIIVKE